MKDMPKEKEMKSMKKEMPKKMPKEKMDMPCHMMKKMEM